MTPRARFLLALPVVALALQASPAVAATFYVSQDGGDARTCNGRADARRGAGQDCAWNSPVHALGSAPRIGPGDTLVIRAGTYDIAQPLRVPSGVRIQGQGHATGCRTPPTLIGRNGTRVLDLDGSVDVEIACLEVTDRSDCVYKHSSPEAACRGDDWGKVGLFAHGSRKVRLRDLNIHGMAHIGIQAAGLSDWTLERVAINNNGWVGWEGNIKGRNSSNSGQIVMRGVEVAWNGCGERWRTGKPWACWAQQSGGYGDGLGTTHTGGQWLIEDSSFHHNTSDGLDLRYLDGAARTSATIRRVHAYANAGNQIKTRGNATIENSVVVGWCSYFAGRDFMREKDQCRASGDAISLVLAPGRTAVVRNSTITGDGDELITSSEGDGSSQVVVQNNILVGAPAYLRRGSGTLSAGHYAYKSPARVSFSGNLFWNVKKNQCPGDSICGRNPRLANMSLERFDPTPTAGSPVIDKGRQGNVDGRDFRGRSRRSGAAVDIGAVEFQRK
jgi:hypothetical protein